MARLISVSWELRAEARRGSAFRACPRQGADKQQRGNARFPAAN